MLSCTSAHCRTQLNRYYHRNSCMDHDDCLATLADYITNVLHQRHQTGYRRLILAYPFESDI
ncbi:MAG: hypothetical protein KAG53_06070 [Endozoicomonadaceae bacterium]|nr:hypothetical protein [Endozoicomonadaceae bacterium]